MGMTDTLTIDSMHAMIAKANEVMHGVPVGIVVAFDVETSLKFDPRVVSLMAHPERPPETASIMGLPYQTSPHLLPGEWFTHDNRGKPLKWNGDQRRIEVLAAALASKYRP
jgi:hypothetical protein